MCFSADADFSASAAVGAVGVATLATVRTPRTLILAALPLLFALHQLDEAFVWLWIQGHVSASLGQTAQAAYLIFAHGLLPVIVPLAFLTLENKRLNAAFLLAGTILGGYLLWQVIAFPVYSYVEDHCVDYVTHAPNSWLLGAAYALVTCGPALISTHKRLRAFGAISLAGVIVTAAIRADLLTSVWCVYVALVSVLILIHFRAERHTSASAPPISDKATARP